MFDWNRYLDSVCQDPEYSQWERVFTPLDVEGRPAVTQLDLMVQAFRESESPKEERDSLSREKTEKYNALEGLRTFAGEHVLLRGRPGSGKTTVLLKLLLEEAEKTRNHGRGRIPVFVPLRRLTTSAFELVRGTLQSHGAIVGTEELESLLNEGRLFLLCDGVNELPKEEAHRNLESFRLKYRTSTPMAFTTRDIGLGGDLGIRKKLEMVPLSPDRIEIFVHGYIEDHDAAKKMLRSLAHRMRDLARVPLLLMMLCSVYTTKKKIPDSLGQVFRTFTTIYEQGLKGDAPVSAESRRCWPKLLAKLAYHMMESGTQPTELALVIPRDQAEKVLAEYLKEQGVEKPTQKARLFLDDLIKHHLLREDARGGIEFLHQLVQEYYASEHLLTCLPDLSPKRIKCDVLNYLKWTEPVAMMMEFLNREDLAIGCVRSALDVDPLLGARLAGCVKTEFQEKTVALVANMHGTSGFTIRLLGQTRSEKALPILVDSLGDEDSAVRRAAAQALGKIGSEMAVEHLLEALGDEDWLVRWIAAYALGEIGSEKAVEHLLVALRDEDAKVRWRAADALGRTASEIATEHLLEALRDEDSSIRWKAAEALGKIGSEIAIEHLLKALRDEDEEVRIHAAYALGDIGSEIAIEHLLKALRDEDEEVRIHAAYALGDIGSEMAVQHLLKALGDEDSSIRWKAADALGKIGSEIAIEHLLKALEDEKSWVRWKAAEALGMIGSDIAVQHLLKALEDEDSWVRRKAAEALGHIGSEKAVEGLITALGEEDSWVRRKAADALGKIGSQKAEQHLIHALGDEHELVRRRAAHALGKIGSKEAVECLMETIESGRVPSLVLYQDSVVPLAPEALPRLQNLAQQQDPNLLDVVVATQQRCRFYNPALLPIDRRFCIVHLSDLHFGKVDRAGDLYVGLLLELKKDLQLPSLDVLVISGDVVNQCRKEGYGHAKTFLSNITKKFGLGSDKVVVVPGNHDMSRDASEAAYRLKRRKEVKGLIDEQRHIGKNEDKYIKVKDEAKYRRRFALFQTFHKKTGIGTYPAYYSKQTTWQEYPDQKVLIVGLNSSWMLDHHYTWRSGLHPDAFNRVIEKAADTAYDDWFKIAVWHHPIKSSDAEETKTNKSWIRDDGFMERMAVAGFSMILHGHAHKGAARSFYVNTRKKDYTLHVVAAGTLDADEDELTPGSFWQYNIITITGTKVSVECRKRVNPRGISRPDKTWLKGDPDKSVYEFEISGEPA